MTTRYTLPANNLKEDIKPAGARSVTVTGLNTGQVLVEGWNGSAWVTLATILPAASGKIGGTSITVPASGRIRASYTGAAAGPAQCKVSW